MINLLPQYWKKKLIEEEIFKVVSILGVVAISAVICFILMLFLMRSFYAAKAAAIEITVSEKERDAIIFDTQSAEKMIIESEKLIAKAGDFYQSQVKITKLFSQVSRALPEEAVLSGFGYNSGKITVKGFAASRNSIAVFKDRLEALPDFKNVVFPAENWLQARDINFSASLDLAGM